jgi:hypothetical protein
MLPGETIKARLGELARDFLRFVGGHFLPRSALVGGQGISNGNFA